MQSQPGNPNENFTDQDPSEDFSSGPLAGAPEEDQNTEELEENDELTDEDTEDEA